MIFGKRKLGLWLLGGILVVLVILLLGTGVITDYLWMGSLGYASVFMTRLVTKVLIFMAVMLPLSLIIDLLIKRLYKDYQRKSSVITEGVKIKKTFWIVSTAMGAVIAFAYSNSIWLNLLEFLNGAKFNLSDPIFGYDIGFFIFALPFLRETASFGLAIVTLLIAIVSVYQLVSLGPSYENFDRHSLDLSGINLKEALIMPIVKNAKILLVLWFGFLGGIYFLKTFELLQTGGDVVFGAGYTDVNVTLLAYRIYMGISLVTVFLIIFGTKKQRSKMLLAGPVMLIAAMVLFSAASIFVQKLVVEPDEINKERQYLTYNIEHTQEAYNIKAVESIAYPYEETLTYEKLVRNDETIRNIRINDARPMIQTFNQIQSIRLYYDFVDVNIDRYTIDGEYTQVFITPRELNPAKLDAQAKTWVNEYLKFTHGYGVVISPVNRVTEEGQPELLMRNIPPITNTDLLITRPEIYFGQLTDRYVLVNALEKEFDYPSGDDNVESLYEGADGIKLNGIKRLLFAIDQRSMQLLVSSNITADSRILLNRNVLTRVQKIAPFLTYDASPYIVVNQDDGKLYWIIDAYTTSNQYPYSEESSFKGREVSYIRNSVKVVVDAYEGTTSFYAYDDNDPIIQTYSAIFPELFKEQSEFPLGLAAHVRYPMDYFDLQSRILRKYHVNNPMVFYNGEDLWDIAQEKYMGDVQDIEPNYVMFKINGKAEFTLILPYTPRSKPNMTALLVARNDAPIW